MGLLAGFDSLLPAYARSLRGRSHLLA